MRRVFALLGAVAMVAVAVLVRDAIDDDSADGDDGGDRDGSLVLACDEELAEACRALTDVEVVVVDSAATSAAIVGSDRSAPDLWLTSAAWFELTAGRAQAKIRAATAVATTRVLTAVVEDRSTAIEEVCAAARLWRCLGDNAGQAWRDLGGDPLWGTVRTGLPDARTAVGLGVLVSVAAGHFDGTAFAANDFDASFRGWLSRLAEPAGSGDRDPAATLLRQQGTYSAAGTTEARLDRIGRSVTALAPEPVVPLDLVLVALDGDLSHDLVSDLRQVLVTDHSWQPASGNPGELLKPGVTGALFDLWKDVTR